MILQVNWNECISLFLICYIQTLHRLYIVNNFTKNNKQFVAHTPCMQLVSEKKIYKLVIIIQIIYRPNVYTNIVLSTQGIT